MWQLSYRFLIIGVLLALSTPAPSIANDIGDGAAAYKEGDFQAAIALWEPLAEGELAGDPWAQYYMGMVYQLGRGVPKDRAKAKRYYFHVLARLPTILDDDEARRAGLDLPIGAIFRYAMIHYREGLELEEEQDGDPRGMASKNLNEARITLDRAGFYGHAEAFYNRAVMTEFTHGRRFFSNRPLAMALYTIAAELGHTDAEIQARRLSRILDNKAREEAQEQLADYRKYMVATKTERWQDPLDEPVELLKPVGKGRTEAQAKAQAFRDNAKLDEIAKGRDEEPSEDELARRREEPTADDLEDGEELETARRQPAEPAEEPTDEPAEPKIQIPNALDELRRQRAAYRKAEKEKGPGAVEAPKGLCVERAPRSKGSIFTKVIKPKDPDLARAHPPTPGLMQLMPFAATAMLVTLSVEIACGAGRNIAHGPWAPRIIINQE